MNRQAAETSAAVLDRARDQGRDRLDELESKTLLKAYGIPTVAEAQASSRDQAVQLAEGFGYPVVLKGLGAQLAHKSELGLVRTGLGSAEAVGQAFEALMHRRQSGVSQVLVQPQLEGKREFVAGLFRDPQFGPVVMFGLGGIYTEALRDVSFRLCPVSESEAGQMLSEIAGSALLGRFRHEAEADRQALVRTLLGLSRLAEACPTVAEIDINPLLVSPDGTVQAVDALAVLGRQRDESAFPPANPPRALSELFHPRSVAFVGASARMGKWGHLLPTNTVSGGFSGDIFLVNPRGGEMSGRPVYQSVQDIPGPVDLAVVTIPAGKVAGLIPELQAKGVRYMLLISSGFSETGPEGRHMEEELVRQAREAGILILGPNTMGICNPHIRFYCTGTIVHPRAGSTAMVSQSGNMGVQLLSFADKQGIGIRGFCGSGNEAMLTVEDYLDGLAKDETSRTLMLYIESVKNGRRFFESARRVSRHKPIVLLKGGETEIGHKAASSHTGALSSNTQVFNALCRQAGIIKVEGPMDLLDLSAAFSSLPLPKGNRVAIMTLGGGWGVITADLCAKYGLTVPELSEDIRTSLDSLLPDYWSRSNPVDLVGERDLQLPIKVLEALMQWDGCDAVINLGIIGRRIFVQSYSRGVAAADPTADTGFLDKANQMIQDFEEEYIGRIADCMSRFDKPVIGVRLQDESGDKTVLEQPRYNYNPVFFQTPENAVKVCAEMYRYHNYLQTSGAAAMGEEKGSD
jgi:acyl-CoA synthetase (NDP forming)